MFVWKAISSIVLMIFAMPSAEALMAAMAWFIACDVVRAGVGGAARLLGEVLGAAGALGIALGHAADLFE